MSSEQLTAWKHQLHPTHRHQLSSISGHLAYLITSLNPQLLLALALGLAYHGALGFYTFKRTYDAYVHIFFADHYARYWFDHWDYRWYTGFTMTSYPPGSQQTIALLSHAIGLQHSFILVQTCAVLACTIGIYRFAKIWVSETAAGYAALLLVFSSSMTETVHVFGQLPTIFSLGFLLNALPFAYRWLKEGDWRVLLVAWSLNAATTAGHHVTTLFGAVFFVAPVIGLAIIEQLREPLLDESPQRPIRLTRRNLLPLLIRRLRRIIPVTARAGVYGIGLIAVLVVVVLPYWLWSKSDPITQVAIPHASRDSFILNLNAGLVFWIVPYGVSLIALPYAFYKGLTTKAWPMTLSLALLVFLGTGGTTPFPRMLLGGAFDILTLDRFTFWATITVLPLLGEFVVSLRHGNLAKYTREQFGDVTWHLVKAVLLIAYLVFSIFVSSLTQFRRFQPEPIDFQPLLTFLDKDEHWRWRYLPLGFGDQTAWLSAQTTATTVDGNYHSARRLPELTTTPIERLEGAKFRGMPGIGSLQQFLAVPNKYNLKYVFSNDQFYDPLLFFSGWHRLQRLENGIVVWERADIPPLPEVLPRKEIPVYQRVMWGIVPMSAMVSAGVATSLLCWYDQVFRRGHRQRLARRRSTVFRHWQLAYAGQRDWLALWEKQAAVVANCRSVLHRPICFVRCLWFRLDALLLDWSQLPHNDDSPVTRWQVWIDWAKRLPCPHPAPPSAQQVRALLLTAIMIAISAVGLLTYERTAHDPIRSVEAYYNDLDFRRFSSAYGRLDPVNRPDYESYLKELSLQGGLVASYGKLDSVTVQVLRTELQRIDVVAQTVWITALAEYPTTQQHTLILRDGRWYIAPDSVELTLPSDPFFRQRSVAWGEQDQSHSSDDLDSFAAVLDRPDLQLLSTRLVRAQGRYSVVGELINTDADPGDVTIISILYDEAGNELTRYNAQTAIMHKLLPKEVTPFRVDFEGVAGAVLSDTVTGTDFDPADFTPIELDHPVAAFETHAQAVVTGRDLNRAVAVQGLVVAVDDDGTARITGQLRNTGTQEATIPHVLITYYDADNRVVWVDHGFVERAIRPQQSVSFEIPITPSAAVAVVLDEDTPVATASQSGVAFDTDWIERRPLPPKLGYASFRVSVHAYTAATQ